VKRADVVLILALLVVSLAFFAFLRPSGDAMTAGVYFEGRPVHSLPLAQDGVFRWEDGKNFVEVTVENGSVSVTDASCPDRDCVRTGALSRAGQSAVCLPNRVSVVLSGSAADTPDAALD